MDLVLCAGSCDNRGMRTSFTNFLSAQGAGLAFNMPHHKRLSHFLNSYDLRAEERPYDSLFDQIGSGRTTHTKRLRKLVASR